MLPQSCNKFSMMRAGRKEALFRQLLGKKMPKTEVLTKIRKTQKNLFEALLCSILNIEITCAVFTKGLAELTRICKDRAKEVNSPVLEVPSLATGIDWQKYGVYTWVKNQSGATVKLKHVQSKEEVDLSHFGHQVDDSWKFDRNWDTWKCRLVKGKVAMLAFIQIVREGGVQGRQLQTLAVGEGPAEGQGLGGDLWRRRRGRPALAGRPGDPLQPERRRRRSCGDCTAGRRWLRGVEVVRRRLGCDERERIEKPMA